MRNSYGEGGLKAGTFNEKHTAKLEFPVYLLGIFNLKEPSVGGMDIFWSNTINFSHMSGQGEWVGESFFLCL